MFQGADEASAKLAELDCFKNAKSVKVNLDKPQGQVRFLTLEVSFFFFTNIEFEFFVCLVS